MGNLSDVQMLGLVFACIFGAALLGFALQRFLGEQYLSAETQDVVKVTAGIVGSMAALVLGLLVASMQGAFNAKAADVRSVVINAALLNRSLAAYSSDLATERKQLAAFVTGLKQRLWDEDQAADPMARMDDLRRNLRSLSPQSDPDKILQARYIALSDTLIYTASELVEAGNTSLPVPLIVVVVIWLSAIFLGFSLFAPLNAATVSSVAVGSAAVSMAIFLIVEMDGPFNGMIQISQGGLDHALTQIASPLRNALADPSSVAAH
jgi:type II secretory pathway pseudopilin PulG